MPASPNAPPPKALSILGLLRPHWASMTVALGAAGAEATAALLEPWPLKIVLDYLLQARPLPGWMMPVVGWIGDGKLAVLNVAVIAVAVIAVAGAVSGYLNTYLTTNVGQRVMHDLRRTLYQHIHRLSLAEHDEKRTGDLIGRVTSDIESIQDFLTAALLGIVTSALTLVGILGVMLYLKLAFHADFVVGRPRALPRGVRLHAPDQEGLA
jgi:ATP-binding cassette subfamily B protein